MKDRTHHLRHIQKKVIQSARKEEIRPRRNYSESEKSLENEEELVALDQDVKRKMPRDYIRHVAQRERWH